jgi:hypothetical protein
MVEDNTLPLRSASLLRRVSAEVHFAGLAIRLPSSA